MLIFDTPIGQLNRVGKKTESALKRLGIATVGLLIEHFPFRYEDYRSMVSISNLREGDYVTVRAKVELIANKRSRHKRLFITEALVADESGQARVIWFGQPFIGRVLKPGDIVFFSGKARSDMLGIFLMSPSYEKERASGQKHAARIVPIYPLTGGITQRQLRFLLGEALSAVADLRDWIPENLRKQAGVIGIKEAVQWIHFPKDENELQSAKRRIKFDELFLLQLRAEMFRRSRAGLSASSIKFYEKENRDFVARFPYTLTKDQKVSAWDIILDIGKSTPMNRLLQGDVGSGKTAVAAIAAYTVQKNNCQTIYMAPTEILARQHFNTFASLFAGAGVTIGLLTSSQRFIAEAGGQIIEASKKSLAERILYGDIGIVIGTHAILSQDILCKNVALVIVDEQHRFGVEQRKLIKEKSLEKEHTPHFLSMTATPIPRSLALALYGDLDVSIIHTMPSGRRPVITRLVNTVHREAAYQFIRGQVGEGRQAFVVCPLIETSDNGSVESVLDEKKTVLREYEKLKTQIFPDLRVGYLHGKMRSKEKESAMRLFAEGKTDILVSTSVIEVGVDIPNASVIMIEDSERFGLAQLHQFRGRVGRSAHQSYCFIFSENEDANSQSRLEFFAKTNDGFELAEYDLGDRGPGEVYGAEQSGKMRLKLATLNDIDLIKLARDMARGIDIEKYPLIKEKLSELGDIMHWE